MRVSSFVIAGALLSLVLVACGSSMDPRVKNPCISYTPDSFAAGWSLPDDRRCTTTDDCIMAKVSFDDIHCSWGWYGGSVSAVSSRAGESRVRARLSTVDPCSLRDHQHVGSVCASPPLECHDGLCGFSNRPPHIAY